MDEPIQAKDKGEPTQFHDENKNKLVHRPSDADGVSEDAYIHQMHVDEPGTESLQDNALVAEGNNATTAEEKGAEIPLVQPLGNEDSFEEESTTGLVTKITHHVQEAISVDAAPNSTHETVEGWDGKTPDLDTNPQETSSQQAPQRTDKLDEVLTIDSEIHQFDDHHSDLVEFSSHLQSSPGAHRESLQSSSPMPVPSSPFTSNPTPPSSVPSSPLIHGAADVAAPLVALNKLPQPNGLQSSNDNHLSTRQPQAVDGPAIAALGTRLEQEHKMQVRMSGLRNKL